MKIVLFEDSKHIDFQPLSKTRPMHFLRCGAKMLYEKFFDKFPKAEFCFMHRSEFDYFHQHLTKPFYKTELTVLTDFIAINIRILPNLEFANSINALFTEKKYSSFFSNQDELLYGYFQNYESLTNSLNCDIATDDTVQLKTDDLAILRFPWDLVNFNGKEIENDYITLAGNLPNAETLNFEHVVLVKPDRIIIDSTADIKPGVIIDAAKGPVIIDKNVTIMHNSVILGPCYIGENCIIKIGSKIYESCSFGPFCKIGGEVEDSIVQGFSNKQHDGFLGHAYIGEWCNLGADTNNSDLKNNYSSVTVQINGRLVDSGSMFVGLFMGDHSKTGINTMFNTGTVVGVCCNVFGEGFPSRNIPDFHWGGKEKLIRYPFNKTIETVEIVKNRRKQQLCADEKTILKQIFDNSN